MYVKKTCPSVTCIWINSNKPICDKTLPFPPVLPRSGANLLLGNINELSVVILATGEFSLINKLSVINRSNKVHIPSRVCRMKLEGLEKSRTVCLEMNFFSLLRLFIVRYLQKMTVKLSSAVTSKFVQLRYI